VLIFEFNLSFILLKLPLFLFIYKFKGLFHCLRVMFLLTVCLAFMKCISIARTVTVSNSCEQWTKRPRIPGDFPLA
jgi:hypothetical protein